MDPYSQAPKPLRPAEFYALLALARRELHGYALRSQIIKDSLGGVILPPNKQYPLLTRLQDEGFVDLIGKRPVGTQAKERHVYGLSPHGALRLREELTRLHHAVEIAQNAHLLEPPKLSPDIQRLLLDLEISAERR
ncbi:MAG TPA: helix-turn-helix transcriptional regulator [Candidatus Saccharimonadia bacterium]|nr:helix-turn-helix transcriptional regulator [Candidatus Saccharimonadia bacterium]